MDDIHEFFKTLFPELDNQFLEIRAFNQSKQVQQCFYSSIDELLNDQTAIDSLAQAQDVYFGVCPRQVREGSKNAVKYVWALWADLDFKDYKGGREEAEARLNSFPFPPTIIVETGNGLHCYWRLKESVEVKDNPLEQYLKAITEYLGADLACAELARVMRLPGTFNHKDPNNLKQITVLTLAPQHQYNLSDFDQLLPLPNQNITKANPPGWFAEAIAEIKEGNRNQTFAKLTGKLLSRGLESNDILALLTPLAQKVEFSLEELNAEVIGLCSRYQNNSSLSPTYNRGETETNSRPFTVVTLPELLSGELEQIEWDVDQVLAHESVGILAGPAGYGKSWMQMDMAIEMARGGLWLNKFATTKGKVLYIDEESSKALLQRRLSKLLKGKDLTKDSLEIHFVIGQSFCLSNDSSVNHLRELLKTLSPRLVIIDSLIRVHKAEENSAKEMSKVFGVIKALVRDFKCSFLIADHQRKMTQFGDGQNHLRGSSEKSAFIDSLFTLKKKDDYLIIEHSKSRFVEAIPSFMVSIKDSAADATQVKYVGDAEPILQVERLRTVWDCVKAALNDGQWCSRKDLVEKGKVIQISPKQIDETLKNYFESGILERDDRKPHAGPGGKQAFYRLRFEDSNSSLFQPAETGTEMNSVQWSE